MKTLDDIILELVKTCDMMELNSLGASLDHDIPHYKNYKIFISVDIELDTDEIDNI